MAAETVQDASENYQTILDARGIICSMSRRGDCYDDAVMAAFYSTVKSELREDASLVRSDDGSLLGVGIAPSVRNSSSIRLRGSGWQT